MVVNYQLIRAQMLHLMEIRDKQQDAYATLNNAREQGLATPEMEDDWMGLVRTYIDTSSEYAKARKTA